MGRSAAQDNGAAQSLPFDQRAIELDPNFAMAYSAIGIHYFNLGEPARASEYLTKAFQLREHASERERLSITAHYYSSVSGELDKSKPKPIGEKDCKLVHGTSRPTTILGSYTP